MLNPFIAQNNVWIKRELMSFDGSVGAIRRRNALRRLAFDTSAARLVPAARSSRKNPETRI